MAETKIKPQAMDTTTRLKSKAIYVQRVMTTASGDVAYTGVGFTPSALIAFTIHGTSSTTLGFADSTKWGENWGRTAADSNTGNSNVLIEVQVSGGYQNAIVKSYDADGFTLTWQKASAPTGTADIIILCLA